MSGERILVVDDEPTIREVVGLYLRRDGFEVDIAADGEEALTMIERQRPDLIVLDLMLPGVDGMQITRQVRASGNLPIIMLTARGEEIDRVLGLELGADDYVTKPFSPRELVARVRAVLRRTQSAGDSARESSNTPVLVGPLRIEPAARTATIHGRALNLTLREYDLLLFLARRPGQVFSREQLLDQVWGYTFASDASTVTVHIRRLREKIEDDPTTPKRIQTVWGVGYKFEADPTG
ncbi:MAG: response regulator transcription factor [Oscillochloris sp.]|nr:response regulator transcription factor [Oscillochloris sp.]